MTISNCCFINLIYSTVTCPFISMGRREESGVVVNTHYEYTPEPTLLGQPYLTRRLRGFILAQPRVVPSSLTKVRVWPCEVQVVVK